MFDKAHEQGFATCDICPRACCLKPGQVGVCRARTNIDGTVSCLSYGQLTAIALDPIEKKPLARYRPGTTVLSIGSYGCNLSCPFCQNHDIAQVGKGQRTQLVSPEHLVDEALSLRTQGCIGLAFTYNEPFVSFEYMRDTALLAHEAGLVNVIVSNGMVNADVFDEALEWTDAINIDLKGFSSDYYRQCGFDGLAAVKRSIEAAAACESCHVEVTTLIVPGMAKEDEMLQAAQWLASIDPSIPYHVTQYHPAYHMLDVPALPNAQVRAYAQRARSYLLDVIEGNMW